MALPPQLAKRSDARELYVSAKDIGRMVVSEYSGWWDDIPSHWRPAPLTMKPGSWCSWQAVPGR